MRSIGVAIQAQWKLALAAALVILLISLAMLAYSLAPGVEIARIQATLAPTLFVPPGGP